MATKLNITELDFASNKQQLINYLKPDRNDFVEGLISKHYDNNDSIKLQFKEGDIVENAIVKASLDWGIFLDINGVDALLHVSDLSHGRVKKPSDLVTIGQKLKVKITKIDPKTNRVSASVKALTEDPYSNIEKRWICKRR